MLSCEPHSFDDNSWGEIASCTVLFSVSFNAFISLETRFIGNVSSVEKNEDNLKNNTEMIWKKKN